MNNNAKLKYSLCPAKDNYPNVHGSRLFAYQFRLSQSLPYHRPILVRAFFDKLQCLGRSLICCGLLLLEGLISLSKCTKTLGFRDALAWLPGHNFTTPRPPGTVM